MSSPIVQYVVVRSDLVSKFSWPMGALIAQACHACTAVVHLNYNDDITQQYLANLDSMHKIILETKDEDSLSKLSDKLMEADIHHKLWVEQPENFPTCLAVKPYQKGEIQKYFKPFKLFK